MSANELLAREAFDQERDEVEAPAESGTFERAPNPPRPILVSVAVLAVPTEENQRHVGKRHREHEAAEAEEDVQDGLAWPIQADGSCFSLVVHGHAYRHVAQRA